MNLWTISLRLLVEVAAIALLLSGISAVRAAQFEADGQSFEYVDGQLVVKFADSQDSTSADSILAIHDCGFVRFYLTGNLWAKATCDTSDDILLVCDSLLTDSSITLAFPNLVPTLFCLPDDDSVYVPADDSVSRQWYLNNTGQDNGKPRADISAFRAWCYQRGASSIVLGILDTGIPLCREKTTCCRTRSLFWQDLADSTRIILGGNYTGDSLECNCGQPCLPNTRPRGEQSSEDIGGHGTGVASILAAAMDNEFGMSGLIANAKVRIIRTHDNAAPGIAEIAAGAQEAVAVGASVINASWGYPVHPFLIQSGIIGMLEEIVEYLDDSGVALVAACGNYVTMPKIAVPSAFSQWGILSPNGHQNVIGVTGTDRWDSLYARGGFRNSRSDDSLRTWVSAPAESLLLAFSYLDAGGDSQSVKWEYKSGTSFAAPQVVGLAGLLLSQNSSLSPDSVRQIIKNSADKVWLDTTDSHIFVPFAQANGTFWENDYRRWHPEYGFGRINCYHALLSQVWSGEIDSNTTWSGEKILWGDVEVDSGVTLTIDSGTVIKSILDTYNRGVSSSRCEIIVKGNLIVKGSATDSVYFTTKYGYEDNLYGIRVLPGGSVRFGMVTLSMPMRGYRSRGVPMIRSSIAGSITWGCTG